jgi:hypothetical protein
MRSVPPGTTQVDVLAIGMSPTSATVDVPAGDSVVVDVGVQKVATLDTLTVKAKTVYTHRVREIAERMKLGDGHYMDSTKVERHATVLSAISELPKYECMSHYWIDGVEIRRDPLALRLLKPEEIGVMEWYIRGTPPQFGRGGCTLVIWTKRALPH